MSDSTRSNPPEPSCGHIERFAIRIAGLARIKEPAIAALFVGAVVFLCGLGLTVEQLEKGDDPARLRLGLWILGGAVACVIAALGLCWWSHRRFDRRKFDALPPHHKLRLAAPALVAMDAGCSSRRHRWTCDAGASG